MDQLQKVKNIAQAIAKARDFHGAPNDGPAEWLTWVKNIQSTARDFRGLLRVDEPEFLGLIADLGALEAGAHLTLSTFNADEGLSPADELLLEALGGQEAIYGAPSDPDLIF